MEQAQTLIARYFAARAGELLLGELPVSALAEKHGTPLFAYDKHVLDRKWSMLRETFPKEFSIFYSVKANPNRAILRYFLDRGCGLEVASAGEFYLSVNAGAPPERILFAGPGKTETELEYVLRNGIGEIHVESLREAERISAICRRLGRRARIALRVNPNEDAEGGAMRMGGRPAPFGTDEEMLDEIVDRVRRDSALDLQGVHLFAGTQILDYAVLIAQYRKGIAIARRVASHLQRALHTLDFGGGLGIPYFPNERELDMERLAAELRRLMTEVRGDPQLAQTNFVIEPGRFLVGEAGVYVTRVCDVKVSRGKKFLIVDGGMNHHLAASGNLGQTIKRNYPVAVVNRLDCTERETVDIVGPLCTPLDVLARGVALPKAEPGDLVGIFQSGAYARTASPLGFLSHRSPPEVWVEAGADLLIRRRGEYSDYERDLLEHLPVQHTLAL